MHSIIKKTGKTLDINLKTAYKGLFNNQKVQKMRGGKVSSQIDDMIIRVITTIEKNCNCNERVGRNSS